MTSAFKLEVDSADVMGAFDRVFAAVDDATPLMRALAGLLARQTEDNFADQSGPLGKWPALAQSTVEGRVGGMAKGKGGLRKDGRISKGTATRAAGLKMLQDSGRLAASIHEDYGPDHASVGTNVIYAAIQQLGGQAGRGHAVTIPARPYLPATEAGLQAGLGEEIVQAVESYVVVTAR